jgi:hypothetical protein
LFNNIWQHAGFGIGQGAVEIKGNQLEGGAHGERI